MRFRYPAKAMLLLLFTGLACTPQPTSWVDDSMALMTLEEKAAQLVSIDISGAYVPDGDPRLAQWEKLVAESGVGGVVVYGGNPHSVAILLNRLQQKARIPLLVSTDFEGGAGQQFAGASEFPSNMAFAATGDTTLMYEAASVMAEEGRAMGIHLSYTPVVDITVSKDNPQESGRSFGRDINLLGSMVRNYVRGFHDHGMLATAKHFPGRGDMKGGPSYPSFTKLDKDRAALDSLEFRAFKLAVDAGVDFMMTEHIAVPSVTNNDQPASVEPALATGVIRNDLHFKGILTSDDLWYDHVIDRFGKEEVAVKAMLAGHDIVLKPKDAALTIAAIVQAVRDGRIKEEHIDQAVRKLLTHKLRLGLANNRYVNIDSVSRHVGTPEHLRLVQEVADRSMTLLENNGGYPLQSWVPEKTVHLLVQKDEEYPNGRTLIRQMAAAFPGMKQFTLRPGAGLADVRTAALSADRVIVSFMVQRDRHGDPAPLRKEDEALLREVISKKAGAVVMMSFGNPHLVRRLPGAGAFVVGYGEGGFYGNQVVYIDSWIRFLKGELKVREGDIPGF